MIELPEPSENGAVASPPTLTIRFNVPNRTFEMKLDGTVPQDILVHALWMTFLKYSMDSYGTMMTQFMQQMSKKVQVAPALPSHLHDV